MDKQLTFADLEGSSRRRTTRREAFLREMDEAVPWAGLVALVEPSCHDGRRGRPPVALERVMRMYFLQIRPGLSDEGGGDACYDSRAFSDFLGVSFDGRDQVPGATTLLRFRRVAGGDGLGRAMPGEVNRALGARGAATRGGPVAGTSGDFARVDVATKRQFGWVKTRYRGIRKNLNRACATFALVSLALWSRVGRPELPQRLPA